MGPFRLSATGHAGARLDRFLADQATLGLTRSRLQALIEAGQVRVDGQPEQRGARRLKGHEQVEVTVPAPQPVEPQPEALPLSLVFQDRDLLVLDKAAGMVVHPGAGHASGTLVNALLHHVSDLQGVGGALRPGLVHRLDKDTSGLLVVAKHDAALVALQDAFMSRAVHKRYLALVLGQPADTGTFSTLHGRHPTQRLRFTSKVRTGKTAVTHWTVAERYPLGCLVEVDLETGRTHQIRMHFAEAGFPLFGDALYGSRASKRADVIGRQALHAAELAFPHPRTGRAVRFAAKPPKDFVEAQRALRRLAK